MSEASSGPRWMLTVWSGSGSSYTIFEFDVEPVVNAGQKVASYHGEREGRAVRVNVTIDRVAAWSLEEIPR
jgi:hypothetical protein